MRIRSCDSKLSIHEEPNVTLNNSKQHPKPQCSVSPAVACVLHACQEINDPLYGNHGGPQEQEELRKTVRLLQFAAKGLLNYFFLLEKKCMRGLDLQIAVTQSLRCPLMDGSARGRVQRLQSIWRPVWRANGAEAGKTKCAAL